jgi:anti-sigma regulatory factor (Ser/Thr protein kinase)
MEDVAVASSWSITDRSMTAEARRAAVSLASRAGFDEKVSGEIAITVTEVCTNLLKHAGGGTIILKATGGGLDLFALDKGPGMRNVDTCLADGYSTAGSSGTGLGAVRRLASRFEIYSVPQKGTIVYAGFGSRPSIPGPLQIAGVRTPRPGETMCGDDFGWRETGGRQLIIVADGLGHGPLAATASGDALRVFRSASSDQPALILQDIHAALRSTRGAAVAVARVDPARGEVVYAGLGNISGAVVSSGAVRHMVSHNGTAGHQAQRIAEFSYPWTQDSTLVMCSDGLTTHWSLQAYPGLLRQSSHVISAVLYRDYLRGRDDAAVVVARTANAAV